MPRHPRLRSRARLLGDVARCAPRPIRFTTRNGREVLFVGRDTRGGDCPAIERPPATKSQRCAADVFRRVVDFCVRTSKSPLQQRLCVGPSMRIVASVASCKGRV